VLFDAVAEVIPEGDTELAAGLLQAGEAVATAFAQLAAGATTDLQVWQMLTLPSGRVGNDSQPSQAVLEASSVRGLTVAGATLHVRFGSGTASQAIPDFRQECVP